MSWSSHQFYAWLAQLLDIPQHTVEQWIWCGLLLGFLFASVHLITMMITRWGDHHASTKSLLFSLLIHISSGVGIVALPSGMAREETAAKPEPIRVHEVMYAGSWEKKQEAAGSTPQWETASPTENPQAKRLERAETLLTETETPQRPAVEVSPLLADIPPLDQMRELVPDRPEMALAEATQKLTESPAILDLEQPEIPQIPAKREGALAEMVRTRTPQSRSLPETVPIERPVVEQVEKLAPEMVTSQTVFKPETPTAETPTVTVPEQAALTEKLVRSQAPAPETVPPEQPGEQIPVADQPAATSEMARSVTRSQRGISGQGETELEVNRPQAAAPEKLVEPVVIAMTPNPVLSSEAPTLPQPQPAEMVSAAPRKEAAPPSKIEDYPEVYRLRDLNHRNQIAYTYGGTAGTEAAVDRALRWLASVQEPGGYWDGSLAGNERKFFYEAGMNCQNAGIREDTGLTGLALLAFLGAGYTHEEGEYADNIRRAIEWMIKTQRSDGYLGGQADCYSGLFYHGLATYALAEAHAMRANRDVDDGLSRAVVKATRFTISLQSKDGSWNHLTTGTGDMSMFGWQLMALKSAEFAEFPIPENTRKLMIKFLIDRSQGSRQGLAAYHPTARPEISASMTAEALFCKQMLGIERTHPSSREAVDYLLSQNNMPRVTNPNLYYWYFGTLAMYQYGGAEWERWNETLRELLVDAQVKQGQYAGSWNPDGHWQGNGGRVYSTALATLSLEVYYRLLPLHRLADGK